MLVSSFSTVPNSGKKGSVTTRQRVTHDRIRQRDTACRVLQVGGKQLTGMTQPQTAEVSSGLSPSGILGAVTDAQTYKNLLYLFISLPLGLVYYTLLMFGFITGLGLAVVGIGLALLMATLLMVLALNVLNAFARVNGSVASSLLGPTTEERA